MTKPFLKRSGDEDELRSAFGQTVPKRRGDEDKLRTAFDNTIPKRIGDEDELRSAFDHPFLTGVEMWLCE